MIRFTTPASAPFSFHVLAREEGNEGAVRISLGHAENAGVATTGGVITLADVGVIPSATGITNRGEWLDVPALSGTLVVNIGDLMAQWTNDRWVSTLHRVIVPEGEDRSRPRQSMVFFHTPNWDADIRCLPTCVAKGTKPRFDPVLAGPHLAAKFQATVQKGY